MWWRVSGWDGREGCWGVWVAVGWVTVGQWIRESGLGGRLHWLQHCSTFLTLVRVEIVVTWMPKISAQSLEIFGHTGCATHMWFCS